MYLSRVEIDTNNRRKIRDLTHLGAYHNWVEKSFPNEISTEIRSRKLWRIDQLGGKQYLLIVSENKPDLHLLETYGIEDSARTKPYDSFLNKLENGMKARFKTTLNPTISLSNGLNKRGRVLPCISEQDQLNYLLARGEKNGFTLDEGNFYISDRSFEILKRSHKKSLRLSKATYEGVLTIGDVEIFRSTLTKGFGKKKAYGFGMMTVIPEV
ncbi:type I-E CRISPR-associated protein Cas6/Cse3/CasE [Proteinivorax tanatarense]|uniref:Type I-E CRISPR-associated protein Cas6/Cse3/CasE n=1 Tax=Proteinivorax tanatarense TaxID=1260629 RepID=A0AAU7VK58_9FIRM